MSQVECPSHRSRRPASSFTSAVQRPDRATRLLKEGEGCSSARESLTTCSSSHGSEALEGVPIALRA